MSKKGIAASVILLFFITFPVFAGPSNSSYELIEYGFGNGGTDASSNDDYSLNGIVGEVNGANASNDDFTVGSGLIFTHMANVPPAPSFTNPGNNYDRLQFILDNGGNPTDAEFAIAISTDNFVTTRYIQNDNTIGNTLGAEDWQTYANWGSGTGEYVTGLQPNTQYKIKVKARQGNYTESGWGPEATATTDVASLTFSVSSNTVAFNNLNSGNSYTDSSKSTTLTTSTNAYNGYIVYGRTTNALTSNGNTIAHYGSPNSAPTTWSGTGFGYTTDDASLTGGTANRFTSGGAKYAGFGNTAPGDPVADHAGPVTSSISNEQFTVSYRVTADAATKAGTYQTTIIYVVVPTF